MFKITDANGKEFNVSFSDITDMNTDLSENSVALEDAEKYSVTDFTPVIVDSNGNAIDLSSIQDEAKNGNAPLALDVEFEATHSGINRNAWNYFSDSMLKDTKTWMYPYAKPFLKNHNMYSEPLGRVVDAFHSKSQLNDERDCINVVYRITDKDAMDKFLDGRYRTMSIGGSVGHVQCNICGKDILKDGQFKFCGHWRGETYNNQKAIWNARDIEYKEGSVVNSPADDWAQVVRIKVIKADDENKDENLENPALSDENQNNEPVSINDSEEGITSIEDDVTSIIDEVSPVADENEEEATEENTVEDSQEETEPETETEETKDSEEALNEVIAAKDAEIAKLKEEKAALETEKARLTDELATEKANAEEATAECKTVKDRLIKVAVAHKTEVAKRIVDKEIINGMIEADKVEDRVNELITKSAKALLEMSDSISIQEKKSPVSSTTIPQIKNNSLVNHSEKNAQIVNKDNEVINVPKKTTLKDVEESIINSMSKKYI